jgi:hypothetical protein
VQYLLSPQNIQIGNAICLVIAQGELE